MRRSERFEKHVSKEYLQILDGYDEIASRHRKCSVGLILFAGVSIALFALLFEKFPVSPIAFSVICGMHGVMVGYALVFLISAKQLPIVARHIAKNSIQTRLAELGEFVERDDENRDF